MNSVRPYMAEVDNNEQNVQADLDDEIRAIKRFRSQEIERLKYGSIRKISNSNYASTIPSECQHSKEPDAAPQDQQQIEAIEQQSIVSGEVPLREKYCHLLEPHLGANFTVQQRFLIKMQSKLDEILDYLRLNRQKKGQLFSLIRKGLLELSDIKLQYEHFKQILFIKPDFYIISEKKEAEGKSDLMVSLPPDPDLPQRKEEFRKALFDYVKSNNGFSNGKQIKIPEFSIELTKTQDENKAVFFQKFKQNKSCRSFDYFNFKTTENIAGKINPLQALIKGNKQNFQKILMQSIKVNEDRIKQEREMQKQKPVGKKEILTVFDQIPLIFNRRCKSSLFKSCLIQDLDKSLHFPANAVANILEVLLRDYSKFFNIINHAMGIIIQIHKRFYNEVRKQIEEGISTDEKEPGTVRKTESLKEPTITNVKTPSKLMLTPSKQELEATTGKTKEQGQSQAVLAADRILLKSVKYRRKGTAR